MASYVSVHTCGACKEFEWNGDQYCKGYCSIYRSYYYADECSCRHYDELDNLQSVPTGGCFLTTACCEYRGLPDDCYELQTLRAFRDEWMYQKEDGKKLIKEYYKIAPSIVDEINKDANAKKVYDDIYFNMVLPCIQLIENKEFEKALELYKNYTLNLKEKYL